MIGPAALHTVEDRVTVVLKQIPFNSVPTCDGAGARHVSLVCLSREVCLVTRQTHVRTIHINPCQGP
jgi:hypothetical protein